MIKLSKPFAKFGKLSLKDLSKITPQPQALWNNLLRSGYINEEGAVSQKYLRLRYAAELWAELLEGRYVDFNGIIPSKSNELKEAGLWDALLRDGYINENGATSEKFQELRQSSDLGLDKPFKDKKDAVIEILKRVHAKAVALEWTESIVIALILAIFIRTFMIQAFKIPTGSMRMTLIEGDRILVSKLGYGAKVPFTDRRLPGYSKPKRGDVVVFIYPEDPTRDFIKRLIAVGGETVEIRQGKIYVEGKLVEDPIIKDIYYYNRGDFAEANEKIKVPENAYFVLGDNSGSSRDSRYWGFVPADNMIGKAELIYWPLTRVRVIK